MAMQTLIHHTTIVTADDAYTVHDDAGIVVEADRIAAIGPTDELLTRYPTAERIDGRGKAVMPGFANVHTHLGMTLARGIYEDLSPSHTPPFTGGLAPLPLPQLSVEEHQVMCQLGVVEAIRSGTTLILEDGAGIQRYVEALAASGVRFLLCERAWDRAHAAIGQPGPFDIDPALAEQGLTRIEALHTRWHGKENGRINVGLAAWAPDMCSPRLLHDLRDLQERLDVMVFNPSQPDLGRGRRGAGTARPAAHRVSGAVRISLAPSDGSPLPLHDARRRASPGRLWRCRGL